MNKTILKWAGSKAGIMDELIKHLPAGKRLFEPFAGSCAVMMNTDYPAYLVADINPDLINLYRQIKEHAQVFKVKAFRVFSENRDEESYYKIREEFNHHPGLPLIDRAAYFLYLNRNGYRGLCRYNQRGNFNVPYGHYTKPYFPADEIDAFTLKAQRATFICAEFSETLQMVRDGDVIYCDPPYDETFNQYHGSGFNQDSQYALSCMLTDMANRYKVIASNSDTELVRNLYSQFDITVIDAARSMGVAAGTSKKAKEIIAVCRPAGLISQVTYPAVYPSQMAEAIQ
ncbi:Dam family site-specific DNA-(adenine-N6)-methyltransferase [Erwiniaceae bacterium BAC15a-03b]|uniref:Site-specific DNA-methyltransferase (adenine-specific) n=1 Tax=Winslowiella arboricola TaxID=2978220 RepID=A0A9J6PSS6_9GAMM|nr:Dam family site-specific DNA-(adenine-N6)-methyltransferase [Winslowiella arboricola]MCU5773093.1 Dam family site-specific DNA-(adenine-N6)-methyltransferase [Winslowiella arboricola]MCU5777812.1 Dam family site-specific DNA-(adenine-N6)-methyltransferase [Winslowiella arboricola]